MLVKVLKLGHAAREFNGVELGTTVGGLLEEAALSTGGYSLTVNGLGASMEAEVSDGDVVTLVPKIEGGGR